MSEVMSLPPELPRESSFLRRLFLSFKTLLFLKDNAANPEKAWLLHTAMDDRTYESLASELKQNDPAMFTERLTVPAPELTLEKLGECRRLRGLHAARLLQPRESFSGSARPRHRADALRHDSTELRQTLGGRRQHHIGLAEREAREAVHV